MLLVASIESAIMINMGIPYFSGTTLPFIAKIVIGTIQLGATVDYAILMTTRFREELNHGCSTKRRCSGPLKIAAKAYSQAGLPLRRQSAWRLFQDGADTKPAPAYQPRGLDQHGGHINCFTGVAHPLRACNQVYNVSGFRKGACSVMKKSGKALACILSACLLCDVAARLVRWSLPLPQSGKRMLRVPSKPER
ncbi:MAG: MMPL family transporter [[Clostridium] leptum]